MKYVITGGAGNISRPLAITLLNQGHEVTLIGRNPEHLKDLVAAGAKAAIGSVEDPSFLANAFSGADAVYSMVPPNMQATDWKAHIGKIGQIYADALRESGVRYLVNLSSVGAHLPEGAGPVSGLFRAEKALNALEEVHILHLRPSYFYQNLLANIPLIKGAGIMGTNFSIESGRFPIVHTHDIAAVAAGELMQLKFSGHSYRYIASDEVGTADIAREIGQAIGRPELTWIKFSDEQALQGMLQAGLPQEPARNYTEMGHSLHEGRMTEDYWLHRPTTGKIRLGDFAKEFAAIFQQS